jgi:hypothetical protein
MEEDFGDAVESAIDWAGYWIEGTSKALLIVAVPTFLLGTVFAISLGLLKIPMNLSLRQVQ